MITQTLAQLLTQDGFREPLSEKTERIADSIDRAAYEAISPRREERSRLIKLGIYAAAAYAAMC